MIRSIIGRGGRLQDTDAYASGDGSWHRPSGVQRRWHLAQDLARAVGWEGDIRGGQGPFVCPIPNSDSGSEYLIAWKQDNNGETFIASPFPLPWLAKHTGIQWCWSHMDNIEGIEKHGEPPDLTEFLKYAARGNAELFDEYMEIARGLGMDQ